MGLVRTACIWVLLLVAVDSSAGQRAVAMRKAASGEWLQVELALTSQLDTRDPVLSWLRALAALEGGRWSDAFTQLNELSTSTSDQQVVVAAATEFVTADGPGSADYLLADALARAGRYEEALHHVETARKKRASDASFEGLTGSILLLSRREEEAERHLDQALALDPTLVDALLARSVVRLRSHNVEGAASDVAVAMGLAPELPVVSNLRGITMHLADDPFTATEDFRLAASSQWLRLAAGSNLRVVVQALASPDSPTQIANGEGMSIQVTVHDAVVRINDAVRLIEAVSGRTLDQRARIPLAFVPAVLADVNLAREGRLTSPLVSNTLEEVGRYGLETLPTLVDALKGSGRLPRTFSVPPSLFGVDKFVEAGASIIGRRSVGVDDITLLLDGVSNMTLAVTGGLLGAAVGAARRPGSLGHHCSPVRPIL